MAQATETHPGLTYEYVSEEYSKFEASISPTNLDGVKHLKLVVNRPFRSSHDINTWLHAFVAKLGEDIDNQVVSEDD